MNSSSDNKGKGKKKAQETKALLERETLTAKERALITQIICPDVSRGGSAILTPALVPARAQATHYRLEHVFTGVPDNFCFCVKPTLQPISATNQTPFTLSSMTLEGEIGLNGDFVGEAYEGDDSGGDWVLNYLAHTEQFVGKSAVAIDMSAGDVLSIGTIGWPQGQYEVFFFDTVALVWLNMGTFFANSAGVGNNVVPFTVGVNPVSAFAISGVMNDYVPGPVRSQIVFNIGVTTTSNSVATHVPITITLPSGSERWRITAMAVKATFFGSTLNNQGEIAIARTYPGWTPFTSALEPWDAIAQLPFQSYDGRLEFGAHAFWLPSDIKEMDFRDSNDQFDSLDMTRIWGCIKGADPSAAIRVELDLILEFYSPLPYFNKQPVPYFSDRAGRLLFELGQITCVGDNPGHLARMGGIMKTVAKGVKTAGEIASLLV